MKTAVSVLLIFLAAFVASCLNDDGGADAQSGVTRAEFDALLERLAAVEANQPGDKVFAAAPASGGFTTKAASAAGQQLGTMVGHLPSDLPLSKSQFFSLKSSSNYLYAVPNGPNSEGVVGIATYAGDNATGSRYVYFGTDDCSSFPIVPGSEVSDYGASQGLVFMIGAGEFNEVIDNPAQYFYIPAGTLRDTNVSYASRMAKVGYCEAASGILSASYVALPNDPGVTGVGSEPIAAPVTLANP